MDSSWFFRCYDVRFVFGERYGQVIPGQLWENKGFDATDVHGKLYQSMVNLLAYVLYRGTFLLQRGEMGRKKSHINLVLGDYKL